MTYGGSRANYGWKSPRYVSSHLYGKSVPESAVYTTLLRAELKVKWADISPKVRVVAQTPQAAEPPWSARRRVVPPH